MRKSKENDEKMLPKLLVFIMELHEIGEKKLKEGIGNGKENEFIETKRNKKILQS